MRTGGPCRVLASCLALCLLAGFGTAGAMRPPGPVSPATGAPPLTPQAREAMRDDSDGLAHGVIDRVDALRGVVVIQGSTLRFDPARVQVYGVRGQPASVASLRAHQRVGFLLHPGDGRHPTVRVFYLQ